MTILSWGLEVCLGWIFGGGRGTTRCSISTTAVVLIVLMLRQRSGTAWIHSDFCQRPPQHQQHHRPPILHYRLTRCLFLVNSASSTRSGGEKDDGTSFRRDPRNHSAHSQPRPAPQLSTSPLPLKFRTSRPTQNSNPESHEWGSSHRSTTWIRNNPPLRITFNKTVDDLATCLRKHFATSCDIDVWMQAILVERQIVDTQQQHQHQQQDTTTPGVRRSHSDTTSNTSTSRRTAANDTIHHLNTTAITDWFWDRHQQWTTRDEMAWVQALMNDCGAVTAGITYALDGVRRPTVDFYTTVLTNLGNAAVAKIPVKEQRRRRSKNDPFQCIHQNPSLDIPAASLELIKAMDRHGIRPSSRTLAALFRCYCSSDSSHGPHWLYQYLKQRYPNHYWTETVWEAAIFACAAAAARTSGTAEKQLAWETALGFYNELRQQLSAESKKSRHSSEQHKYQHQHQQQRRLPSEQIFVALFHVCTVTRNVTAALEVLDSSFFQNNSQRRRQPSPRLWGAVLKVCAAASDYIRAKQVLERMTMTLGTSAETTSGPNVRHYTYYLKALVVAGQYLEAVQVLDWMHQTAHTGNVLNRLGASSVATTNMPEAVRGLGLSAAVPDLGAVKIVLDGCSTAGNFTLARRILDQMKDGSLGEELVNQLDEHCYHTVLTACRDPLQAKELVREMRLSRRNRYKVVAPNHVTFTKAITVCRKARDVDSACFFLSSARNDGILPDVYMYSAAIWTAAEAGNSNSAFELLIEMKREGLSPTIVSYNGAIAALASCDRPYDAVDLFQEIRSKYRDLNPDFSTFNHLAKAIRKVQIADERLALLWRVYHKMSSEHRSVAVGGRILEALISTYGLLGYFGEALTVFESINGPTDADCLRAVLFACSQSSPPEWEMALSLLHSSDIVDGGQGPAHVEPGALCNAMLACSKADQWEESLQLLRLYGDRNLSILAVNSLIASCGRGGRADLSVELLNEMVDFGLEPDEFSFRNAVIACNQAEHMLRRSQIKKNDLSGDIQEDLSLFAWWECAISLLRQMKERGLTPDMQTLSSAISACESAGEWQRALKILQRAIDEDCELNLFCFNAALAACEKGDAWVEALDIYERLIAQGGDALRPNIVTVSSLVLALDKAGQKELAVSKYDEGIQEKFFKSPWYHTKDSASGDSILALDLHTFSAAMAKAAVRSHLESLLAQKSDGPENDWVIVVGKGLRSEEFPVLKSTVQTLLEVEFGIQAKVLRENEGRLIVRSETLRAFVSKNG